MEFHINEHSLYTLTTEYVTANFFNFQTIDHTKHINPLNSISQKLALCFLKMYASIRTVSN